MARPNKAFIVYLIVSLFLLYSAPLLAEQRLGISFTPNKVKQGDILLIKVKTNPAASKISGTIFGKPIHFYTNSDRKDYAALIGIDMETEPRLYTLSLSLEDEGGKEIKKDYKIRVRSAKFGTQRLTFPKEKVELDAETLQRVEREKEEIERVWDIFTDHNLWDGNFITPVEGEPSNNFGLRRIVNGKPGSSHTGLDVSASEGMPVHATNYGRVVFVGNHFFSGRSLVIDHGLGLFTMYFHLSDVLVIEGEEVKKGQLIARVGKSGRVTGAHLHWGVRLNGARVNPVSLANLRLE